MFCISLQNVEQNKKKNTFLDFENCVLQFSFHCRALFFSREKDHAVVINQRPNKNTFVISHRKHKKVDALVERNVIPISIWEIRF